MTILAAILVIASIVVLAGALWILSVYAKGFEH